MSGISFRPWVGGAYGRESRWGLALLLVGEAHYDEGFGQGQDLTEFVVRRHVERQGRQYPFWTKIARLFVDSGYDSRDVRASFWHSVAFYNYVQEFVGTAPRKRPGQEAWARDWPAFAEVLGLLQPDLVLVLGFRLWDALQPFLPRTSLLDVPPVASRRGRYAILEEAARGAGVTGYVKHPSAGFSPDDWRPWVHSLTQVASGAVAQSLAESKAANVIR